MNIIYEGKDNAGDNCYIHNLFIVRLWIMYNWKVAMSKYAVGVGWRNDMGN